MNKKLYDIGTKLYIQQKTGDYFVDMVKYPFTVIGYNSGKLIIQSAKCNFPKKRYYDTLPLSIEEDLDGDILELNWSEKNKWWQYKASKNSYPYIAHFGNYEYQPYLN